MTIIRGACSPSGTSRPLAELIGERRREARRISANLLDTYLGPQVGRRILAGQIKRAEGERMRAVIIVTDLRNFTGLSDRLPGDAVIALLDDYFDAMVPPIQEAKGELLKFMGDGVLAIFPADDDEDFAPASLRALAAATRGLDRLAATNRERAENAQPELRSGIGLHLGELGFTGEATTRARAWTMFVRSTSRSSSATARPGSAAGRGGIST